MRSWVNQFVALLVWILAGCNLWASDMRLVGEWTSVGGNMYTRWSFQAVGSGSQRVSTNASGNGSGVTSYFKWSTDSSGVLSVGVERVTATGGPWGSYDVVSSDKYTFNYTLSGSLADKLTIQGSEYSKKQTSNFKVSTFANLGTDSQGARYGINALTSDSAGTLYAALADGSLRRISATGEVFSQWLVDEQGKPFVFSNPRGIAVDSGGTLYVANSGSASISRVSPGGVVSLYAGVPGSKGRTDGAVGDALFNEPACLFLTSSGSLLVADTKRIRCVAPGGTVSTPTGEADLVSLESFVGDSSGNLFFCEKGELTAIKKRTPSGATTIFAGSIDAPLGTPSTPVTQDGTGVQASFVGPLKLAIDSGGNLFAMDLGDFTLRKISSTAVVTSLAGISKGILSEAALVQGTGVSVRFKQPQAIAVGLYGDVFIADSGYIRRAEAPRTAQAITFSKIADRPFSSPPLALSAKATSGLPINYEVLSGPAFLSGGSLSFSGKRGTVVVRAAQPGNGTYASADPVDQSFVLTGSSQSLVFGSLASRVYGDPPVLLSGTASSGLPVGFEVASGPALVAGNTLLLKGAGVVEVRAVQTGDDVFMPAAPVIQKMQVAKKELSVLISGTTRAVGQANPLRMIISAAGFVDGDAASKIDRPPQVDIKATSSSPPGNYPMSIVGGLDGDYTFVNSGTQGVLRVVGYGGNFEALLVGTDQTPLGKVELSVSESSLTYSGKIALSSEARAHAFTGTLLPSADWLSAIGRVQRAAGALPALDLAFSVGQSGVSFSGTNLFSRQTHLLTGGSASANIEQGRRVYSVAAKASAPWTGNYTMVLGMPEGPAGEDVRPLPPGGGFASVAVASKTGVMSLSGKLSDGTSFSAALNPGADGSYLLWTAPYSARPESTVAGLIPFAAHPDTVRFPGAFHVPSGASDLIWRKAPLPSTAKAEATYRAGFGPMIVPVAVDPWLAPLNSGAAAGIRTLPMRLGLVDGGTQAGGFSVRFGPAELDLGAQAGLLPASGTLSTKGAFGFPAGVTGFKASVNPATGVISGGFVLSDVPHPGGKTVKRTVSLSGILSQRFPKEEGHVFGIGSFVLPNLPARASEGAEAGMLEFYVNP